MCSIMVNRGLATCYVINNLLLFCVLKKVNMKTVLLLLNPANSPTSWKRKSTLNSICFS